MKKTRSSPTRMRARRRVGAHRKVTAAPRGERHQEPLEFDKFPHIIGGAAVAAEHVRSDPPSSARVERGALRSPIVAPGRRRRRVGCEQRGRRGAGAVRASKLRAVRSTRGGSAAPLDPEEIVARLSATVASATLSCPGERARPRASGSARNASATVPPVGHRGRHRQHRWRRRARDARRSRRDAARAGDDGGDAPLCANRRRASAARVARVVGARVARPGATALTCWSTLAPRAGCRPASTRSRRRP